MTLFRRLEEPLGPTGAHKCRAAVCSHFVDLVVKSPFVSGAGNHCSGEAARKNNDFEQSAFGNGGAMGRPLLQGT